MKMITGKQLSPINAKVLIEQAEKRKVNIEGTVGGFKQWLKEGRVVKKGEKSFKIFVPNFKKDKKTNQEELTSYRMVSVFDITQTENLSF